VARAGTSLPVFRKAVRFTRTRCLQSLRSWGETMWLESGFGGSLVSLSQSGPMNALRSPPYNFRLTPSQLGCWMGGLFSLLPRTLLTVTATLGLTTKGGSVLGRRLPQMRRNRRIMNGTMLRISDLGLC